MRPESLFLVLRSLAWLAIVLMAGGIGYAATLSVAYWSGIGV